MKSLRKKQIEQSKKMENFFSNLFKIYSPSNMNTTQKVFVLISLISFITWVSFPATSNIRYDDYIQEWYQIVLLAVWLGSFVGIYLFKD